MTLLRALERLKKDPTRRARRSDWEHSLIAVTADDHSLVWIHDTGSGTRLHGGVLLDVDDISARDWVVE